MKKWIKLLFATVLPVVLLLVASGTVGAATYEPDGGSSTEYLYPAEDCNRTLVVNCVDESGSLIKTVTYLTKRGEDALVTLALYGYDIIGFDSDQGLWETCKITWASGTGLAKACHVQIRYYFRTGLSKEVMTVTVTLRKSEAIALTARHFVQVRQPGSGYTYYELRESATQTAEYYSTVTTSANAYPGYDLKEGYSAAISGRLSYTWLGSCANIPQDNFSYRYVKTGWADDMGEYSSYSEGKDGKTDYCVDRQLFVDFYYDLKQYTVSFDANGGADAPASLTKYHGQAVVIPDTVPVRAGYDFAGWCTAPSGSGTRYLPGDEFHSNAETTLYAVWDQSDDDFSVSELDIALPEELFPNDTVRVTVRADSWDRNDAYDRVPVGLYYDGTLLSVQYINFAAYGVAYVSFDLNVGAFSGTHEIEVRINWAQRNTETNPNNNRVSQTIEIIPDGYAFSVQPIPANAPYREGTAIITSFLVYNHSDRTVLPEANAAAKFTVYYLNDNRKIIIAEQTWDQIVVPVGESNLIWFRWNVPSGLAGTTVYCQCDMNPNGMLKESDLLDNTATLTAVIAEKTDSQTADPGYETQAPGSSHAATPPAMKTGSASWTVWEYDGGAFVQKKYGIRVSDTVPMISPGAACETAVYENGVWVMRSGYGITVNYAPALTTLSGCKLPSASDYTGIQTVYAAFPEYGYSFESGECRTLIGSDETWSFVPNPHAAGNEAIHYIPVWIADGEYTVSVTATDIWTPAGMITATRTSNTITIDGNIFDDYYIGT